MNKSPCSTRAAEQRRRRELRPLLHWKGLLFIARASRLYRPRPRARPRRNGELLKLLLYENYHLRFCTKNFPVFGIDIFPIFLPSDWGRRVSEKANPALLFKSPFRIHFLPYFSYHSYPRFSYHSYPHFPSHSYPHLRRQSYPVLIL